jgi:hypothetical protein
MNTASGPRIDRRAAAMRRITPGPASNRKVRPLQTIAVAGPKHIGSGRGMPVPSITSVVPDAGRSAARTIQSMRVRCNGEIEGSSATTACAGAICFGIVGAAFGRDAFTGTFFAATFFAATFFAAAFPAGAFFTNEPFDATAFFAGTFFLAAVFAAGLVLPFATTGFRFATSFFFAGFFFMPLA